VHGKEHKTDLQSILMSIPDPTMPDEKLFHSVNNMLMMTLFFVFALTATMHVPLWTYYQKWWGKRQLFNCPNQMPPRHPTLSQQLNQMGQQKTEHLIIMRQLTLYPQMCVANNQIAWLIRYSMQYSKTILQDARTANFNANLDPKQKQLSPVTIPLYPLSKQILLASLA